MTQTERNTNIDLRMPKRTPLDQFGGSLEPILEVSRLVDAVRCIGFTTNEYELEITKHDSGEQSAVAETAYCDFLFEFDDRNDLLSCSFDPVVAAICMCAELDHDDFPWAQSVEDMLMELEPFTIEVRPQEGIVIEETHPFDENKLELSNIYEMETSGSLRWLTIVDEDTQLTIYIEQADESLYVQLSFGEECAIQTRIMRTLPSTDDLFNRPTPSQMDRVYNSIFKDTK